MSDREILDQIGYDRVDTMFVSLNLTDDQWNVLADATLAAGDVSTEELITKALVDWMANRSKVRTEY